MTPTRIHVSPWLEGGPQVNAVNAEAREQAIVRAARPELIALAEAILKASGREKRKEGNAGVALTVSMEVETSPSTW